MPKTRTTNISLRSSGQDGKKEKNMSNKFEIKEFINTLPEEGLVLICGRPYSGKSTCIIETLNRVCENDSALFFSVEMSKVMLNREFNINRNAIMDDSPNLSFDDFKNKVQEHGTKYIFLDYVQLMDVQGVNSYTEALEYLVGSLSQYAKDNHKLIISTFQLRMFEKKENIQLEDFLIFDYRQAINADAVYFIERTSRIKKLK
jgi:replicative DNA helicase